MAGAPGQGCTLEDLRWFVIQETGKANRNHKEIETSINRNNIAVDMLKLKVREKLDGDQVQVKIAEAMQDKVAEDEFTKFKDVVAANVDDYSEQIQQQMQ